jgi:3-dehydroquinate synthase
VIHTQIRTSQGECKITVNGSFSDLKTSLKKRQAVVITDSNVHSLYKNLLSGLDLIELEPGEGNKSLATIQSLYDSFLDLGVDRSTLLIGLGGGVVCDLTGFAASSYLRGVPFAFVPTTLLAQVDAALGGKNGVNLNGYKNLVGVFRQPEFVFIDFSFLDTLPKPEKLNGMAEIIKHALIAGISQFQELEQNWPRLLSLDKATVEKTVSDSIAIKSRIVESDMFEKGPRRILNFGHTLGHAIEREGMFKHGEAVSLGMVLAARLSVSLGMLSGSDAGRIQSLLEHVGLPTQARLFPARILDAVKRDKKRQQKDVHFVLLSGIGRTEIKKISFRQLEEHIHDLCQPG